MKKFFGDFKKFITRGNVIDMAVGVVVGGSFSKIVNGLVTLIINPFVGMFIKQGSLDNIKTVIQDATYVIDEATGLATDTVATPEVAILWGTWFQTIIDFIITAFCIFIVIHIISKIRARLDADKLEAEAKAKADADAKAKAEKEAETARQEAFNNSIMQQEALLREIRDLMKDK